MGLLEDLLEGTSAVADTLDKGSQALRQGQEGLEYTKERLDWAKSDRPKKDRAACADIRRKMDSMRRRYIFLIKFLPSAFIFPYSAGTIR